MRFRLSSAIAPQSLLLQQTDLSFNQDVRRGRLRLLDAPHIIFEVNSVQMIQIDVISPIPEGWGICLSCEMLMARANLDKAPYERGLDEYPPEWQEDFQRLSDVILNLSARYDDRIMIRIYDPRSLQGLFKSLRHGVRRYPTFIVDGKKKVAGWDIARVEEILHEQGVQAGEISLGGEL